LRGNKWYFEDVLKPAILNIIVKRVLWGSWVLQFAYNGIQLAHVLCGGEISKPNLAWKVKPGAIRPMLREPTKRMLVCTVALE
jgi:hypothetical protein